MRLILFLFLGCWTASCFGQSLNPLQGLKPVVEFHPHLDIEDLMLWMNAPDCDEDQVVINEIIADGVTCISSDFFFGARDTVTTYLPEKELLDKFGILKEFIWGTKEKVYRYKVLNIRGLKNKKSSYPGILLKKSQC